MLCAARRVLDVASHNQLIVCFVHTALAIVLVYLLSEMAAFIKDSMKSEPQVVVNLERVFYTLAPLYVIGRCARNVWRSKFVQKHIMDETDGGDSRHDLEETGESDDSGA